MFRVILVVFALLAPGALAAPPEHADPALAPWYNSLQRPSSGFPCCSIADCRPVRARTRGDRFEALIDGEWRVVPDKAILNRMDNPTGQAVACWRPNTGILCFVLPPES